MKKWVYLVFVSIWILSGTIHAGDVSIIANTDVPQTILTKKEIMEIYLGKRVKWPDHSKITFALSADMLLHKSFLETYVDRTINQFQAHWINLLFTGQGVPPKPLESDQKVVDFVSRTSGAIGYISGYSGSANIKIITVE
jgi:hypothetical protein